MFPDRRVTEHVAKAMSDAASRQVLEQQFFVSRVAVAASRMAFAQQGQ